MNQNQAIALYQPMLQSIAQRMVGSLADAEDIVQDTLLKWLTIDTSKVQNTKAYLITSVKNNCINHLEKLKKTRDECLHNLNPAELIDWYKEKEFFKFDMDNEISAALKVLHKKLEPVERGIFVLRELFDLDYEELQVIFDKKKDNCRKLFSRAKEKLSLDQQKEPQTDESSLNDFKTALNSGDSAEMVSHIKKQVN